MSTKMFIAALFIGGFLEAAHARKRRTLACEQTHSGALTCRQTHSGAIAPFFSPIVFQTPSNPAPNTARSCLPEKERRRHASLYHTPSHLPRTPEAPQVHAEARTHFGLNYLPSLNPWFTRNRVKSPSAASDDGTSESAHGAVWPATVPVVTCAVSRSTLYQWLQAIMPAMSTP